LADDVAPGVLVVDASGVDVGGTLVGTVRACLVGGRVEVTKRGADGVAVSRFSVDIFTQDVDNKKRMMVRIFLYIGKNFLVVE
jgi:hypothetical protein